MSSAATGTSRSGTFAPQSNSNVSLHLSSAIERLTPLFLADRTWDKVGAIVTPPLGAPVREDAYDEEGLDGPQRQVERTVHTCIDVTPQVAEAALEDKTCCAIVSYHPPIFRPMGNLAGSTALEFAMLRLLAAGIHVHTVHTAADAVVGGTNDLLASACLGPDYFSDIRSASFPLRDGKRQVGRVENEATERYLEAFERQDGRLPCVQPLKACEQAQGTQWQGAGMGRLVRMDPTKLEDLMADIEFGTLQGCPGLQLARSPTGTDKPSSVAICAGSGSSVLNGVDADVYLTGEMSHHEILAANANGTHVVLCTHDGSERPWLKVFTPNLERALHEATQGSSAAYMYTVRESWAERTILQPWQERQ